MADGFVDLQAELSATEDEGADFFRALSCNRGERRLLSAMTGAFLIKSRESTSS